jgi:endonuclease YncB( thermonuclease family)
MRSNILLILTGALVLVMLTSGCLPPARKHPPEGPGQNEVSKPASSPIATPHKTIDPLAGNLSTTLPTPQGEKDTKPTTAKVVGIQDGDTITIVGVDKARIRIRLAGIDAPEKGRPFSDSSKSNLSELVYGKVVTLECNKVDRYNRPVCKIFLNGEDVGLGQILDGMAWHFKRYENEQSHEDRVRYAEAEEKARAEGIGMWKDAIRFEPRGRDGQNR